MMKCSKYILFALVLLHIAATVAFSQVLTLEQCREMALQNNKEVTVAQLTEEKTAYDAEAYRANFLPKISLSGAYLYTNKGAGFTVFPGLDLNLKLSDTWFAGVRAKQPLYMGGKILTAYRMSMTGKEIAHLNRSVTRTDIIIQTDEAYWTHLKTLEMRKVAVMFGKVVAELMRNVEDAYATGLKSKNDLLKVRVQANKAELQLRQADNAVRLSQMNLCHVLGLPLDSAISIVDTITDGHRQLSLPNDHTARPEYSILERQIDLKSQQVKLVRSDFLPNVGVMANYGYMHGLELNGSPLIDHTSFSALLSVSVPLFQWGEGRSKIRAAKAEQSIMRLKHDDMSEQMALELAKTRNQYEETALEVTLTANALQQAEENMKTSHDQWAAGLEPLSGYLEAQTLWQEAYMKLIDARIAHRLSETYYLKAAGKLDNQ